MAASTSSPGDAGQAAGAKPPSSRVEPQEVGWMFVPQYYSLLNKDPGRLHCFYQKRSTLIHSVEGEEAETRYGQQEIHDRIMELGFEDAKVYVSNVDSQPSAEGGIIVQVIGEMSNRAGAWRKFAQTFFLAEQPNGYFVLNDIFRFIKEDQDSGDEQPAPTAGAASAAPQDSSAAPAAAHHFQAPSAPAQASAQPSYDFAAQQPRAPVARTPSPKPSAQAAEEPARPQANGWHDSAPSAAATSAPSPPAPVRAPTPPAPAQATPEAVEQPSAAAEAPASTEAPAASSATAEAESKPVELAQPAAAPAQAAPAEPAAPAPAASKSKPSWASLAANASGTGSKWSSAVVSGHSGVVSAAPPQQARTEQSSAPAPSTSAPTGAYNHQRQPFNPASITTGQCFVKGVLDSLPVPVLRAALQERFGTVKELDLIRGKACAFLEFASVESAREAIRVSQSQREGGEGGIPIPETSTVVHVEIRRSKDEVAAYQASRGIVRSYDSSRGGYGGDRGRGAPRGRGGATGSRPPPSSGPRPAGGAPGPSASSSATPSSSGQPRVPRA